MKPLKQKFKLLGATYEEIGVVVGVGKQAVSNWVSNGSIPAHAVKRIASHYNVSSDWILDLNDLSDPTTVSAPRFEVNEPNAFIYGHIDTWDSNTPLTDDEVEVPFFMDVELAAGSGAEFTKEQIGPKLRFSKSTLRNASVQPENAACVKVSGNSMEPRLYDGDVVGVDLGATNVIDGKSYAINHDGMLRIKRLYRMPRGGLRVNSLNADEHPDEIYDQEERRSIVIIGKVFWSSSMW